MNVTKIEKEYKDFLITLKARNMTAESIQNDFFTYNEVAEKTLEYLSKVALRSVRNRNLINATGYDSPVFTIDVGTKNGKGFVCEYDIRFDIPKGSKIGELMETRFGSWDYAVRLAHKNENEGVRLTAFTNKSENISEIADRSAYHHIKVEYSPDGSGGAETIHYLDGILCGKSSYWKGTYSFLKPAVDNIPCVTFRAVPGIKYTAYISSFKLKEI